MTRPPGVPQERTLYAWHRTATAVALVAVTGARLLAPQLGTGALVVGVVGLAVALGVGVTARRRFSHLTLAPTRGGEHRPVDARALAVLSATALLLGLCGVLLVVQLSR